MKKNFLIAFFAGLLAIFYSCSTDFDIIAPYKEIIVINGLVDGLDSVHYIRVGKAFLGEGNVLTMAQQTDSTTFGDILTVQMEKLVGSSVVETFSLDRTTEIPKDPGIFGYPYQVLYKTTHSLLEDATYRIVVKNNQSGNIARSTTKIFKDIHVSSPITPGPVDWATNPDYPAFVNFEPTANAKVYDLIVRFHYREIDSTGFSVDKSLDWNFSDRSIAENTIKFQINKNEFYEAIGRNIPYKSGYTYRIDSLAYGHPALELILMEGSEDLVTYYKLQNPNTGLTIDRPTFTTVENGLGLFTSRLQHRLYRGLDANTQNAIDTSVYTRNLDFRF